MQPELSTYALKHGVDRNLPTFTRPEGEKAGQSGFQPCLEHNKMVRLFGAQLVRWVHWPLHQKEDLR